MSEQTLAPPQGLTVGATRQPIRLFSWRNLRRHPRVLVSAGMILLLILIALLAPVLDRYDP